MLEPYGPALGVIADVGRVVGNAFNDGPAQEPALIGCHWEGSSKRGDALTRKVGMRVERDEVEPLAIESRQYA
jgi:hypothetical protein